MIEFRPPAAVRGPALGDQSSARGYRPAPRGAGKPPCLRAWLAASLIRGDCGTDSSPLSSGRVIPGGSGLLSRFARVRLQGGGTCRPLCVAGRGAPTARVRQFGGPSADFLCRVPAPVTLAARSNFRVSFHGEVQVWSGTGHRSGSDEVTRLLAVSVSDQASRTPGWTCPVSSYSRLEISGGRSNNNNDRIIRSESVRMASC